LARSRQGGGERKEGKCAKAAFSRYRKIIKIIREKKE
jgi:hypothetical protein